MNALPCQSLDDYLAHDLTGDARVSFVAHLANCPECRRTVEEYERLSAVLAAATAQMEPVPVALTGQIERRLRNSRRRRLAGVAAALAATAAALWLFTRPVPPPDNPGPVVGDVRPQPIEPE